MLTLLSRARLGFVLVAFALAPVALVEGPGLLGRRAEAGEGRLVEEPLL